jgi:hypothetical protein
MGYGVDNRRSGEIAEHRWSTRPGTILVIVSSLASFHALTKHWLVGSGSLQDLNCLLYYF